MSVVLDFIDDVLDSILGESKTITDIQITNLLTAGRADKDARSRSIRNSRGNLEEYGKHYRLFQRNYRKRYSPKFLSNLGYLPTSTGTTRVLDETTVLPYIITYDPLATNILHMFIKYITEEEAAYDWMEDNIGWSNDNSWAIDGGKKWVDLVVSNDTTDIQMDFTREAIETIEDNLTTNYSYDSVANTVTLSTGPNTYDVTGTTGAGADNLRLTIDTVDFYNAPITELTSYTVTTPLKEAGTYTIRVYETVSAVETLVDEYTVDIISTDELYDVPTLDGTDLGGYYRIAVILQNDGVTTVTVDTSIETANWSIPATVISNEKMMIRYDRGGTEWYFYIEDASTIPNSLFTTETIDFTAIVPLKEDNVIFNENREMERMLSKLNITRASLLPSLENPDMDSAYLMMGIYPNIQTPNGMKVLFNTFDSMLAGSGDVSISISKLSMVYSFTMVKTAVNGSVLPIGTYSNTTVKTASTEGFYYTKTLLYQATSTQYKKIVITDYSQTYTISGQRLIATFGSIESTSRVILPIQVLNKLRYREFVEVYEDSFSLLAYSVEVIELSWEQSSFIGFVLKATALIIFVFSASTGSQAALALWKAGEYATLAILVATNVAIMLTIGYSISVIMEILVNEFGLDPAIASLIMLAVAYTGTKFANISFGAEQWLSLANTVLDEATAQMSEQTSMVMLEDKENAERMLEENEQIVEMIQAMRGEDTALLFDMNIANRLTPIEEASNYTKTKIEIFGFEHLYDIDFAIDQRIQIR